MRLVWHLPGDGYFSFAWMAPWAFPNVRTAVLTGRERGKIDQRLNAVAALGWRAQRFDLPGVRRSSLLAQHVRQGFRGPVGEDAVDVIHVCRKFGALLPCFGEMIPVMLEQRLFQVAVAEAAGAEPIFKIPGNVGRRNGSLS